MSYRTNTNGGFYGRHNAAQTSYSHRYNAMSPPPHGGNIRHNGTQSRNNQLYMGDLDPSWDENVIRSIWNSLGESNVDIKLMWNNRNPETKTHLGYCFVQFASEAQASNALLKNGMPIPGYPSKTLRLNWTSSSSNNTDTTNEISIFVGDLAPNVTEADLFELFIAKFPSTSHVKVMYDQITGVSKGYAFVKFGSREDQKRALQEMTGTSLKGRAIRVGSAGHQNQRGRIGPGADSKPKGFTGSAVSSKHVKSSLVTSSQFILPAQPIPELNNFTDRNNTTLFVVDLPPLATEGELRAYFQPFGNVVYIKIPEDKQCGFVQYVDRSSAEMAILRLQGTLIRGSRIKISWGRPAKPAITMKEELKNSNWQYESQPKPKQPVYGYLTPSFDYNTPGDESQTLAGKTLDHYSGDANEKLLLPGLTGYELLGFPASASGLQSLYEASERNVEPHIAVKNDRAFIKSTLASISRLEDASNGYGPA